MITPTSLYAPFAFVSLHGAPISSRRWMPFR